MVLWLRMEESAPGLKIKQWTEVKSPCSTDKLSLTSDQVRDYPRTGYRRTNGLVTNSVPPGGIDSTPSLDMYWYDMVFLN